MARSKRFELLTLRFVVFHGTLKTNDIFANRAKSALNEIKGIGRGCKPETGLLCLAGGESKELEMNIAAEMQILGQELVAAFNV